ncbi:hypothetical protein FRAAL1351 [Frankia alni ACN14a]|uniref:Uncharacterized protein n=1 Tax=Frankia alni (strain DSM 45986 / CECT 9034 / ACN14a) TaxID=326424 RepID=Q0RR12_FRAAA|nr:hypothetical protein FRAAL1351 [Frankia alni ACN14a]
MVPPAAGLPPGHGQETNEHGHTVNAGRQGAEQSVPGRVTGKAREAAMGTQLSQQTDRGAQLDLAVHRPVALRRQADGGAITPTRARRVPPCPKPRTGGPSWSLPASRRWAP